MKKIREKFTNIIRRIIGKDVRSFLHFFLAFTGLFLILTGIILQATSYGRYVSVDSDLRHSILDKENLIQIGSHDFDTTAGIAPPSGFNNSNNDGARPGVGRLSVFKPGLYIILYNSDGEVLNSDGDIMAYAASNLHMNRDFINHIGFTRLNDHTFRTTIIRAHDNPVDPDVAYIQVSQNIDQIEEGSRRTQRDIIITMGIFWVLSLFVSIYLSRIARQPLEQALERQKAFISNASHELRTPLAIMQNRLELLFRNPNGSILDESENISASLNEVRNMRELTTTLLNMAKSDGSVEIQTVETNRAFFEELFESFEILAEDHDKVFIPKLDFDGTVLLDQSLVKQVLTIFFDNALKYTGPDGEVTVTISNASRSELLMVVADNGPGISESHKKKIFDRFYRIDEARTRGKGGLGLGLSLAKEIVTAMKGRIFVEDNEPKGTKFIVRLKV